MRLLRNAKRCVCLLGIVFATNALVQAAAPADTSIRYNSIINLRSMSLGVVWTHPHNAFSNAETDGFELLAGSRDTRISNGCQFFLLKRVGDPSYTGPVNYGEELEIYSLSTKDGQGWGGKYASVWPNGLQWYVRDTSRHGNLHGTIAIAYDRNGAVANAALAAKAGRFILKKADETASGVVRQNEQIRIFVYGNDGSYTQRLWAYAYSRFNGPYGELLVRERSDYLAQNVDRSKTNGIFSITAPTRAQLAPSAIAAWDQLMQSMVAQSADGKGIMVRSAAAPMAKGVTGDVAATAGATEPAIAPALQAVLDILQPGMQVALWSRQAQKYLSLVDGKYLKATATNKSDPNSIFTIMKEGKYLGFTLVATKANVKVAPVGLASEPNVARVEGQAFSASEQFEISLKDPKDPDFDSISLRNVATDGYLAVGVAFDGRASTRGAVTPDVPNKKGDIGTEFDIDIITNLPMGFDEEAGDTDCIGVGSRTVILSDTKKRQGILEVWCKDRNPEIGKLYYYDAGSMAPNPWVAVEAKVQSTDVNGNVTVSIIKPIKWLSVASDDTIVILDGNGKAYSSHANGTPNITFTPMPLGVGNDALTFDYISVGNRSSVWAVNLPTKTIYQWVNATTGWVARQKDIGLFVAAGVDGTVVGLNTSGQAFKYTGIVNGVERWEKLGAEEGIDRVAVGDAKHIWIVKDGLLMRWGREHKGPRPDKQDVTVDAAKDAAAPKPEDFGQGKKDWVVINDKDGKPATGFEEVAVNAVGSVFAVTIDGDIFNNDEKAFTTASDATVVSATTGVAAISSAAPAQVAPAKVTPTRKSAKKAKKINVAAAKKTAAAKKAANAAVKAKTKSLKAQQTAAKLAKTATVAKKKAATAKKTVAKKTAGKKSTVKKKAPAKKATTPAKVATVPVATTI